MRAGEKELEECKAMEVIQLRAQRRTVTGKQVKRLRRQDLVPGIIYGRHIEPLAVQFEQQELVSALRQAGTSSTLQVILEGNEEPYLVIFRDVQHHPIRRDVLHVDLQALSLEETVRVPVTVVLVGEAPVTADGTVTLMQVLNEVEIEALPTALIPSLEVDISQLQNVGDSITVADLQVPEGVTILNAPDEVVVQTMYVAQEAAAGEEEEEALAEEEMPGVVGAEGEPTQDTE